MIVYIRNACNHPLPTLHTAGLGEPCTAAGMADDPMTPEETHPIGNDNCCLQHNCKSVTSQNQGAQNVHECYDRVMACMRAHPIFMRLAANRSADETTPDSGGRGLTSGPAGKQTPGSPSHYHGFRNCIPRDTTSMQDAAVTPGHDTDSSRETVSRLFLDMHNHPMFKLAAEATGSCTATCTAHPPGGSSMHKLASNEVASPRKLTTPPGGKSSMHGAFAMLMEDLRAHPTFRGQRESIQRATDSPDGGATVLPTGGATGLTKSNTTTTRVPGFRPDTHTPCVARHTRIHSDCLSSPYCPKGGVPDKTRMSREAKREKCVGETRKMTSSRPRPADCSRKTYDFAARILLNEVDTRTLENQMQKLTAKRSNMSRTRSVPSERIIGASRIPVPRTATSDMTSTRIERGCLRSGTNISAGNRDKDKQLWTVSVSELQRCQDRTTTTFKCVCAHEKHTSTTEMPQSCHKQRWLRTSQTYSSKKTTLNAEVTSSYSEQQPPPHSTNYGQN
ncbi:hypothetical protein NP493_23g03021 [Ridgeia piscesae]|uniref:Uncharacterized protein n=1 Tax=Ridgeia piscesae TaxID=27915 RepID=A0AAD9UKK0_RIDPI|nr:hypothetical protein NP493_23g03021 [Ridgeia piscesae]